MNLPNPIKDRRGSLRMETIFTVEVESAVHGFTQCVARNISRGGIMLETHRLLPLGTEIEIHFTPPGALGGITARAQVKNHYYLHFAEEGARKRLYGVGARFCSFADDGLERLEGSLDLMVEPTATVH